MNNLDFLLIADPRIWQIKVKECHELLVDLKTMNFKIRSHHIIPYEGFTKVRQTVANKLQEAMKYLPNGIKFLFSEGFRPLSIQKKLFTDYYNHLSQHHPHWNATELTREVTKFVAPPEDVPPHSTGGAIDITLVDADGNELDMGSLLDDTPDNNENCNFTYANNISEQGKANRAILINALTRVGFVNYPAEWWHWSYGDKYWAYYAKHPYAIYGSVEVPNNV